MGAERLPIRREPDPMLERWRQFAEVLQPGSSGNIAVDRFTLRVHGWTAPPGSYVRLKIDGGTMMANTYDEYATCYDLVNQAHGDVLIGGLGLCVAPYSMLARPEIRSITIVENSPDVLKVVGSQVKSDKIRIVQGDIHEWLPRPGTKFQTIYFDCWEHLRPRDLPMIARLHQRFAPFLDGSDPESWMDSWQANFVRAVVRDYLATGRVAMPRGYTCPPVLLEMCREDLGKLS